MKTFLMEGDDYVLDENKNLIMIEGIDEIRQSIERILTTNINEWFLNTGFGLNYEALQGKGKDMASVELTIREAVLQDNRVEDIDFIKITLDKATRHLDLVFDAVTIEGILTGIEVRL